MQIYGRLQNRIEINKNRYVKFTMVALLHLDRFVYVLKQRRPQNNFTIVAPLHIHNKGTPEKKHHDGGPLNCKSYKMTLKSHFNLSGKCFDIDFIQTKLVSDRSSRTEN